MNRKISSLLSLSKRAGKIVIGSDTVENSIKNGNAKLVIISTDASENTQKKFTDKCKYRNIPLYIFASSDELNRCVGTFEAKVFAITDENFTKGLITEINNI